MRIWFQVCHWFSRIMKRLVFNAAYWQGRRAFYQGLRPWQGPQHVELERHAWLEGWTSAYLEARRR